MDERKSGVVTLALALALMSPLVPVHAADPSPTPPSSVSAPPSAVSEGDPERRPLDLRIPDYTWYGGNMFGQDSMLDTGYPADDVSTVEIQAFRPTVPDTPQIGVPYVTGGFGALFWAAMNPAQAWRIFLPDPLRADENLRATNR